MALAPSTRVLGYTGRTNELLLSAEFGKKVISVDYDYPGFASFGSPGVDTAAIYAAQVKTVGKVPKNTLYYKINPAKSDHTGLYRPVVCVRLSGVVSTATYPAVGNSLNVHSLFTNATVGALDSNLVRVWDVSAGAWMSGTNDQDRYIVSVSGADGAGSVTLNTALTTATAAGDLMFVGDGVENFDDWVVVEDSINFRADAKPFALDGDVIISALYRGRFNSRYITQHMWGTTYFPANLWAALRHSAQRMIFDDVPNAA